MEKLLSIGRRVTIKEHMKEARKVIERNNSNITLEFKNRHGYDELYLVGSEEEIKRLKGAIKRAINKL